MKRLILSLCLVLFFCNACKQPVKTQVHPNYDLTMPEILKMPRVLNEISGIAFNNGRPDTLYGVQDEEGRLFYFPVSSLDVKHKEFGKKGDFEDIAISNGTVVILGSDGVLFSFPLNINESETITDVQETAGLLPAGEYEGMYGDETGELFILCKSCKGESVTKSVHGYILQMSAGNSIGLKSTFRINTKDIAAKLQHKNISFKPSALARNNNTNEWYILSSVNKLLVIADDTWAIKETYTLDPALFDQPEGIAFDNGNNLYISNERGSASIATVLKFAFMKDKK
ncbi:MAG: SdiA-regulated domain-containing protein [Ferruginibacter sp.]